MPAQQIVFASDFDAVPNAKLVFDALDADERATSELPLPPTQSVATPYPDPLPGTEPATSVRVVPFQPMSLRRLTEVMRFPETSDEAVSIWRDLAAQIGRIPVELSIGSNSVGLRLLDRLHAACDAALLHGAILWELDEAMVSYGFDLGFYEAQDLTGLDVAYARRKAHAAPSKIADRAVEEGRIGKKIGWGWYRYPGGGGAVIDPLIEDLIREEAWFAKVGQIDKSPEDWLVQILEELSDEVSKICSAPHAVTSDALRAILVHGLGFPEGKLSNLRM